MTLTQDDLDAITLIVNNAVSTVQSAVNGAASSSDNYLGGKMDGLLGMIDGVHNHISSFSTDVSSSFTSVQTRVDSLPDAQQIYTDVSTAISLNSPTIDLTPVIDLLTPLQTAELNNLHEDIVSLGTQLSTVIVPLQSLNGNGSEYKDGVQVLVAGRLPVYTVSRSYMSMMDTDTYTCVYDLEAPDGSKATCPESFLTPYVTPIVTP